MIMKENNKPEVLAPAGGTESIYAAVRCGADGIYVGGKSFSARANAVNFSYDELKAAAEYCHIHGVKLYRAMNVAVLDSEAEEFYDEVKRSAEAGIDGLIVQDLGGLLIARAAVPDMPLHGSTQMTFHTPLGAEFAKKLGICRIVSARELTLDEIRKICETGMETEVFVHGAQCMCLSGQCYMSAVIGSRSANRGQCAQACRLPFSAVGKPAEEYALSLKDMSLVRHVDELCDIGCASFKIEGRMKRPEYVAAAVTALRNAVDGTGDTDADMKRLEAVFSRSGFTDGYLMNRRGADMFGYRRKEDVVSADGVLSELAALYAKEKKTSAADFVFTARRNEPSVLEFSFDNGNAVGKIEGRIPEEAKNRSLSEEDVTKQLSKLGDTRFYLNSVECHIDEGVMLPASELNRMRREAVSMGDEIILRKNTPVYHISENELEKINAPKRFGRIDFRAAVSDISVLRTLEGSVSMFVVPIKLCEELEERYIDKAIVRLPDFVSDEERLLSQLKMLREKGFVHFMCGNLTHMGVLSQLEGIKLHGGTGMNITNSYSVKQCENMGFADITASFELKEAQINGLKSNIPVGVFAYGRLPLMVVRNCPVRAVTGCGKCTGCLTDRTGRSFPVKCDNREYSVIYNSDILDISDKLEGFSGADFAYLDMQGLSADEALGVTKRFFTGGKPHGTFTRGLYYRGIY